MLPLSVRRCSRRARHACAVLLPSSSSSSPASLSHGPLHRRSFSAARRTSYEEEQEYEDEQDGKKKEVPYVLLCPGQGSQKPGMAADLAAEFPVCRQVLSRIDDALSLNLSSIMRGGSMEELTPTEIAQPAILAHTLAVVELLEQELGLRSALAKGEKVSDRRLLAILGHSLGEFSALSILDCFDVEGAASVVRQRGLAMAACSSDRSRKGGMLALHDVSLESASKFAAAMAKQSGETIVVANINTPRQVVLSGTNKALALAQESCRNFDIRRTTMLQTSAPFHSPLLGAAKDSLQEVLSTGVTPKRLGPEKGSGPVAWIPNVTASPVTTATPAKLIELLANQVTAPVRWADSMMASHAIVAGSSSEFDPHFEFVIVGPGQGLANMLRDFPSLKQVPCHVLSDVPSVLNFLRKARS